MRAQGAPPEDVQLLALEGDTWGLLQALMAYAFPPTSPPKLTFYFTQRTQVRPPRAAERTGDARGKRIHADVEPRTGGDGGLPAPGRTGRGARVAPRLCAAAPAPAKPPEICTSRTTWVLPDICLSRIMLENSYNSGCHPGTPLFIYVFWLAQLFSA